MRFITVYNLNNSIKVSIIIIIFIIIIFIIIIIIIINNARTKQRSLIITLLDLKNAFGEVHHKLIHEVLEYHHIPDHIKNIIRNLYTDFQTSIITEQFNTPFITVNRGVLQGDCLSPLLFNMAFNTFIQHIKSEKYSQFGFWKINMNSM